MTSPPKAIPGRWFTLAFGAILVVGVVVGFLVVIRFQKIMTALDEVRRAWPQAAVALEDRYRRVDELFNDEPKDASPEIGFLGVEWQNRRRAYLASTQYDVQARLVGELDEMADQLLAISDRSAVETSLEPPIRALVEADRALGMLQSDAVGWLCMQLFRLNIPDRIFMRFN